MWYAQLCSMRQTVMTCKKTNRDENGTIFMKTNCSYLFGWMEIMTNIEISSKMVNPKYLTGNREERANYQHCQKYSYNQL